MNGTPGVIPVPPASSSAAGTALARPSLARAFRAIWVLTWRARVAPRKLPLLILSVLAVPLLMYFTLPREGLKPFHAWTLDIYLSLLVPLYCLFVCGALVRDELQAGTLSFFLTRPTTRARFLCLSYLTHMAWVQAIAAISALLILLAGVLRGVPEVGSLAGPLLGAQFLAILAYTSLSTLFGLISKRYIILAVIYGLIIEVGIGRIPSNINSLSMSHHIRTLLAKVDSISQARDWVAEIVNWSIAVLLLAPLIFLAAATALFTLREYHQGEEQQK